MPKITYTNAARADLMEAWMFVAEENLYVPESDGLTLIRVLHHAQDVQSINMSQ